MADRNFVASDCTFVPLAFETVRLPPLPASELQERCLADRELHAGDRLGGAPDRDRVADVLEHEIALDGEVDGGGRDRGKTALLQAPVPDVMGQRRRYARRQIPARHDDAAGRIAPDPEPGPQIVEYDEDEPADGQDRPDIVAQIPGQDPGLGRFGDDALGECDGDRQALARPERPRCLEGDDSAAIRQRRLGVLRRRAVGAGIGGGLLCCCAVRQMDDGNGLADRKRPFRPGGVPVDLVVVVEEADLPVGAVGQFVGVDARLQEDVLLAEIDPHHAAVFLDAAGLRLAVAPGRNQLEGIAADMAVGVLEGDRKVPVDAAPDLRTFRVDADRLGDDEVAVPLDRDIASKQQDFLGRQRHRGRGEQDQEREDASKHGDASGGQVNLTSGRSRSAAFSSSK